MNLKELAHFLGLSAEELFRKAKDLGIDVPVFMEEELDEELIDKLKERLASVTADDKTVNKSSAEEPIPEKKQKKEPPKEPKEETDKGISKSEKDALKKEEVPEKKEVVEEDDDDKSEEEHEEAPAVKKKEGQNLFSKIAEEFFVPVFKTPAHRNMLILGAVMSALIAFLLTSFLQKKPVIVEKEDAEQQAPTQITIRGGFRGEKDLFQLIWEMHQQGYYKQAYDYAERFIEEYHESDLLGDVYYKRADILFDWDQGSETKRYKDARLAYEKAIAHSPHDSKVPWAKLQIANSYYRQKLYTDAADYYEELIEQYPTYQHVDIAQSRIALCFLKLQEYERARLEYKKLIEIYPESALVGNAYLKLAEIHYRNKELKDGIAAYQRYIQLYPHTPKLNEVYFRIAKLYKYNNEYKKAISFFEKSIGKYPHDSFNELALYHIAECYLTIKEYEKAREYYTKLIETYPKSTISEIAYHRIGDTYLKAGDKDEAIEMFEKALNAFPDVKAARLSQIKLGELYFEKKNYDRVISIYSDILVSDPNYFANDRLILRIAQAHFEKGDYLDAADWYLRLIQEFPTSILIRKAYFQKAKSEEAAHFYENAINSYVQFIQKFPEHQRLDLITLLIGNMYFNMDKYVEAINYWEDMRKKFPLSDYRYEALVQIGRAFLTASRSDAYLSSLIEDGTVKGTLEEVRESMELQGVEALMSILNNKALEGSPEYLAAGEDLITYYFEHKALDKALETVQRIISVYPMHPKLYTLLNLKAKIYYALNLTDETITAYEDLISLLTFKLDKANEEEKKEFLKIISESYFALGDLLYSQDKISESLYLYLEGIKKMPEDQKTAWPLYQIANCYSALGNYNKANFYYDKVKKDFPDDFWSEYVGWNKERIKWEEEMKKKGIAQKS